MLVSKSGIAVVANGKAVYAAAFLELSTLCRRHFYKVDKPKHHHASRKPVGGESIPVLGFYGSANLG